VHVPTPDFLMKRYVELDGNLVEVMTPAQIRSGLLWATGLGAVALAMGGLFLWLSLDVPTEIELATWQFYRFPGGSTAISIFGAEGAKALLRVFGGIFGLMGAFVFVVGIPSEIRAHKRARREAERLDGLK